MNKLFVSMLFVIVGMSSFGGDRKEEAREVHPVTGCPIYNEGETFPVGVQYHIRLKDGSFAGSSKPAPQENNDTKPVPQETYKSDAAPKEEKIETSEKTGAFDKMEGFIRYDQDGIPVFKENTYPPPGISFRRESGSISARNDCRT